MLTACPGTAGPLSVLVLLTTVGEGGVGNRESAELTQLGGCSLKEMSTGHIQTAFKFLSSFK